MLVDNSIVVIENIYRMRNEGVPARKAAIEGAKQVAGAITSSTLTTVCVFAPIVFTEGITRLTFVEMGTDYCLLSGSKPACGADCGAHDVCRTAVENRRKAVQIPG